jgi:hypothetical protein
MVLQDFRYIEPRTGGRSFESSYMPSLVFFKIQYASEANSTNHSKHFHYIFFKLRWQQETAMEETHDEI